MTCYIKRLTETAKIPTRATTGSAGYDIYSDIDSSIIIAPGEIVIVPTGIAIENNDIRTAIMIYPRSGLASKYGITLANCVGVIDSDYRGEIKVALINNSTETYILEKETRIAQLIFQPIKLPVLKEVNELRETTRNENGFGSTGMK